MLYEPMKGKRRLFRHNDEAHPYRGGKITPDRDDIPQEYWSLLDWYHNDYDHGPD